MVQLCSLSTSAEIVWLYKVWQFVQD